MSKLLKNITKGLSILNIIGSDEVLIQSLQIDSRYIKNGDAFIAIKGTVSDGHSYISSVVDAGAKVIFCEILPNEINDTCTYVLVENTSTALGHLANLFYDSPSSKLNLVGVTGTNGKTSVVTLSYQLFKDLGYKVGLISTVENKIHELIIKSTHTTPDAISINKLLSEMVEAGCTYCFMEVSSHAVDQKRIYGLEFKGAVFTNITHDHLDYHKTFENYIKAKKGFFDLLNSDAFALVNCDDRNGMVMLQNTRAKRLTFSLKSNSDFKCKVIENSVYGLQLDIDGVEIHSKIIGDFNAYNLIAVYSLSILLGEDKIDVLTKLSNVNPPEGRFQQLISKNKRVVAIVDYAHTPDALKNVLHTIKSIKNELQSVFAVIGCGGERDKNKRPLMGAVGSHLSDTCILTSDNPRSENPNDIINEMYEGVDIVERKKVIKQSDRREAIKMALMMMKPEDILLVAGKGHENYQEINGVKYNFLDKEVIINLFNELEL